VNEVNDARRNEMHTAELLKNESTAFGVEMSVKNMKICVYNEVLNSSKTDYSKMQKSKF
jgi:hypothetical protein